MSVVDDQQDWLTRHAAVDDELSRYSSEFFGLAINIVKAKLSQYFAVEIPDAFVSFVEARNTDVVVQREQESVEQSRLAAAVSTAYRDKKIRLDSRLAEVIEQQRILLGVKDIGEIG